MNVRIRPVLLKKVYFFNKILTKPARYAFFCVILDKSIAHGHSGEVLNFSYKAIYLFS